MPICRIRLQQTSARRVLAALAPLLLAGLVGLAPAQAASIDGIAFPNQVKQQGQTLKLNGLGLREATFFRITVYAMALYAQTPSKDPAALLNPDNRKRILMQFVRDVDADKLRDAWEEGFENNGVNQGMAAAIQALQAAMVDIREGDQMRFDINPDHIQLLINEKPIQHFEQPGFGQALISVWLGPEPPNDSLKAGLLSNNQEQTR